MTDHLPEFNTDDELEAWFDETDLGLLDLEEALHVQVAATVQLVVDGPWTVHESSSTATSGHIEAPDLVSA